MSDSFESFLADIETASPTELLQVQCQLLWYQRRQLTVIQWKLADIEKAVKLTGVLSSIRSPGLAVKVLKSDKSLLAVLQAFVDEYE